MNNRFTLKKFGLHTEVKPHRLKGVSHTSFNNQLMPRIIEWLEKAMPSLVSEAYVHLNTHNIALYPFEITSIDTIDHLLKAYQMYFKSLTGEENKKG